MARTRYPSPGYPGRASIRWAVGQWNSGKTQLAAGDNESSTVAVPSIRAASSVILRILISMIIVWPGKTGAKNRMSLTAARAMNSPGFIPLPVVWLNRRDALCPMASMMQVPGMMAKSGKWPSNWSSLPVTFLRVLIRLPGLQFQDAVHHQHRKPLLEARLSPLQRS